MSRAFFGSSMRMTLSMIFEAEGTSTWTYDTKSNGIGKLSVVKGPNGYKKELSYDAFGRVKSTTLTTNGETLFG
jgi:YD repeat-containing protein